MLVPKIPHNVKGINEALIEGNQRYTLKYRHNLQHHYKWNKAGGLK